MTGATRARVEAVVAGLRGRRIHVLGPSGTEGSSVLDFLVAHGVGPVVAHDLEPPERFALTLERTHPWLDAAGRAALLDRLRAASVTWRQGARYLEGIEEAEVIFVPQSWRRHPQNARVREAAERGARLSSLTHLFFETWPGPIAGITGTNGKFTVATLLAAMLEAAGIPHVVSGNDRTHTPALYRLDVASPRTWLVLEISNRQLVDLPYSPRLAVVTNIAPHHLDDHGTMEAYVEAKRTIVRHQTAADAAVLNADDPAVAAFADGLPATVHWFSRRGPVARGAFVRDRTIVLPDAGPVLSVTALAVPGAHTVENALAAAAAAAAAGTPVHAIADALRAFRGLPYRFRLVAERDGVRFYEDSLGTNPTSAAAAIAAMDRPFHLIAGGLRKGARPEDFAPMVAALGPAPVRGAYLIGATAAVLAEAIGKVASRPPVVAAGTLEAAMAAAWAAAVPGEAILLSPGCESFDQFADYRERGDRFRALVGTLPHRAGERAAR
ncbi:MAG: UDP-N-acetylmuramoyl-L-alanine--D-glutamate ligase [Armatimonadota bacterium]|nr:UDP-N-acetylmuramoyl-L-alanine--D-glutamate ligase [Armatimonadota bacterium]MDR7422501.1 UDP-N-acetylmuramoyl-L-alanine--D-glutamate ligase [Armatimonadota bacterium]MDR7455054.1 UDP-N-acetylmuramoyl-L-alanine--D-glutamate ligase [Armatimonadota bacterium]MDR7495633.1 UDP-N-acetylmuramoyl-L-alanine--D-glutamate ligase [Armatimonadota bacterium]